MNRTFALLIFAIAATACGGSDTPSDVALEQLASMSEELEAMEAAEADRPSCEDLVGMDSREVANDEIGKGCWYTQPGLDDPTLHITGMLTEECEDGRVIYTSGPEHGWGIEAEPWQAWPADGTHPLNLKPHPCS